MMVRIFNGEVPGRDFPFRAGPFIPMVTPANIANFPYEGLFGPRDFQPVFHMDPGE
jgi:protein TorT